MKKWRIVVDSFSGFEVQFRSIFWPFWRQHGFVNTHSTIEEAKLYLRKAKKPVVYEE